MIFWAFGGLGGGSGMWLFGFVGVGMVAGVGVGLYEHEVFEKNRKQKR